MSETDIGMKYQDALKTAIRHVKEGSGRIAGSIVDQVERYEGAKAAKEFAKEIEAKGKGK
jgi:type III secretion system FlhB-like substrate exporter